MRLVRKPHPFDLPDWIFELKVDGFRALAHFENGKCELVSRNRNTFASFRSLAAKIGGHFKGENGILDGEIVSLDERGYPQFEDLMFRRGELFFVVFERSGSTVKTSAICKRIGDMTLNGCSRSHFPLWCLYQTRAVGYTFKPRTPTRDHA